jgi:archaellum component FlaC
MSLTSGFSFFRDEVQTKLLSEVQEIKDNVTALQEMLSEVCSTWNVSNKKHICIIMTISCGYVEI